LEAVAMSAEQGTPGAAAVAVSNRAVQLVRQYTGRGATQARTTIDRDHVVIVMRDSLSTYERTLAENGSGELVLDARRAVQEILRPELIAFIEEQFGRGVIGFMSANQIAPDLAAEVFVLAAANGAPVS
jgi:uncharacterized protein YbcI